MTTQQNDDAATSGENLSRLEENVVKIESLTARLLKALSQGRPPRPGLSGPDNSLYMDAATAYFAEMAQNPAKLIEHQIAWWGKTVKNYVAAQQLLAQGQPAVPAEPDSGPKDRRFANPLWDSHPYFHFIKEQYQLNAAAIAQAVEEIEGMAPADKQRLAYFSRQITDMMAPTNFLGTNPDALEKAAATEGQSLIDGLENLVSDLEANDGDLVVTLADKDAFKVGGNLATTPGEVVWRNHLLELIQYTPTTETVHEIPLIIFPPWINKFYILDLKPQNSFIKWVVDQGYTLFVVSWVNPGPGYRQTGLEDYVEDGFLAAMREARAICATKKINAIGYCIGGTTLALTLALMQQRKMGQVASATFFTTLTDFADRGEMAPFLEDDFVDAIEAVAQESGIMDHYYMARTFTFLRANDLIYRPAIRSYMLGEPPPAFDLLYWNGDGTNLPAKMAVDYLRGLCQANTFAGKTGYRLGDAVLRICEVGVPLCAIACESDHIAAWKQSYRGIQQMGSTDKTFILSGSGHIAGIVNPPSKTKYGHYTNADLSLSPEAWQQGAEQHEGSWWPLWEAWLQGRSGSQVAARPPGDSDHPPLCPAPGTYVVAVPAEASEGSGTD